jgi:glycosyltransferase involved in cell wall biosynthesis
LAGLVASRVGRAPHVVRTCGPELARSWSRFPGATSAMMPITKRLLSRADAVVVKSDVERRLVEPSARGRVHLIPNAVGAEFFVRRRTWVDDEVRLLTVCQLEAHKGVSRLLTALAAVQARRFRLTVVGDGSQRGRLERLAKAAGVAAHFVGKVPHAELPPIYAVHDAFVLPSVLEGCSNAVLEALAAGLPVVGNRSAIDDLVDDGVTGVLAESADERGLTSAVDRLLRAAPAWPAMRDAARRSVAAYTPTRLLAGYRELLLQVCMPSPYVKERAPWQM